MDSYRIVRATVAELNLIESIARRTWPATFGDILSTVQIEYMLAMMYQKEALQEQLTAGHIFHLLLDSEGNRYRAVGYVSHQLDYEPGVTKIHKLYVLPGAQGRGFGRALIARIVKIARKAGQQKLRLDVNYQNKAVTFYERLGFEKIDRFDTKIGNGYLMEDWRMELTLPEK